MRLREFADQDVLPDYYYFLTEEERSRFDALRAAAVQARNAVQGAAAQATGAVKGKVNQLVTVVKNSNDAIRLIPQIISDPKVLAQAITLLRQALKQELVRAHPSIVELANKISGTAVSVGEFFKTLLVYAAIKGISKLNPTTISLDITASTIGREVFNQLSKINGLAGALASAGAGNLMTVLDSLKIAHDLFFDVLSRVSQKLSNVILDKTTGAVRYNLAKVVEARGRTPGGWFLLNTKHQRVKAVTDKNFDELSRLYASPRPGDGYLGFVDSTGEVTHHLMTNHANQIGTVPGKPW